jgi:hypothetical protein
MIYLRLKVLLVVHEPRSMVKLNFSTLGRMSGEAVENYDFPQSLFALSFALSWQASFSKTRGKGNPSNSLSSTRSDLPWTSSHSYRRS